MGILDDLKSQAEQKNRPTGEQPVAADAEEFYRAQVKQRMVMAYDFFTQLVNQLNEIKLVIKAEYPFKPEGKNVTLLQQGYKAYSDHITDPRQVTLSFICSLANPATYDIRGRGPAMAQGELLERYQFKYEKLEARDQNRMVIGARFKLQGPLQVKCVLQFDEAKQIIKLLLTNLVGPGTSQYNLKPEQLDEAFMDHLGKYLLRKEANLFKEEISDDAKAMLRKKLQQEQLQREAELRALEEQRKAEEAARKQNSTTEHLKKAVSQSVVENTEKLRKAMEEQVREKSEKFKTMFNKLKNRTGGEAAPEQTSTAPAVKDMPPINRQAGQTASARQNASRPKPPAEQKKPVPPKVFVSSASNPFLKPEDFAPVPSGEEEQTGVNADAKNPAAQSPADTATPATARTHTPTMPPASAQARPAAESSAPAAKTANPFLQTKSAAVQTGSKKPTGQSPVKTATPATPTMPPVAAQTRPTAVSSPPAAKTEYQFAQRNLSKVQIETKKPTGQSPVQTAAPAAPTVFPTTGQAKSAVDSSAATEKTANPFLRTKLPAAPDESGLSLEPVASGSEPATPDKSGLSLEPTAPEAESFSPAAAAESGLSLEPTASDAEPPSQEKPDESGLSFELTASDSESSSPAEPAKSGLSLEPTAPDIESSSPAEPAKSGLSLEPTAPDTESSSPAAPDESAPSLEPNTQDSESPSLATKAEEPQPEASSDHSALSLEEELERDLARFMDNAQQQPPSEVETSDVPPSTSDELDLDLAAPDVLEINFEETDNASDVDKTALKNSKL